MSVDLEIGLDLALMVGEMQQLPCEHSQHGTANDIHAGPATYYVSSGCDNCGIASVVFAACQKFVDAVVSGDTGHCDCGATGLLSRFVTPLCPIN